VSAVLGGRRDQEPLAGLHDLATALAGLGSRVRPPLRCGCGQADELVVLGRVEREPVGEVSDEEVADSLQRRLRVDRRREDLGHVAEQVEPRLELDVVPSSRALCVAEPLAFLAGLAPLRVVEQNRLGVERLPGGVPDDRLLLADAEDASVASDEPIGGAARPPVGSRRFDLGQDPFAVVGMEQAREEIRLRLPLTRRVAEQLLHLRADVDQRATPAVVRQPGDAGNVLRERAKLRLSLAADVPHTTLGAVPGPPRPLPPGDRQPGGARQQNGDRREDRNPGPEVVDERCDDRGREQEGHRGRQEQLCCTRVWAPHGRKRMRLTRPSAGLKGWLD
jgi:hypothetical protein